ncbi:MAG: phage integrase N-terminal SAM-like domain-containing protein [Chloroflexi bacterium]|nr:phage integrase N-terminal SAM-like domain-containing protein [Chloroflexota bacterium]
MTQQQALLPVNISLNQQDLPAIPEGLGPTDLQRIRQSLDSSVSENTRANYRSAWKTFERWAQARAALAMPASPTLIAAYLSHLAEERRLSVATIRLHRAAIAAIYKAQGHEDPTDNEGVRRVMKGIARAHGRAAKQAKPLTAEALAAVRATAPSGAPWETARSRNQRRELPGGPGWTWRCCPSSETACYGAQRQQRSPGATLSYETTEQH